MIFIWIYFYALITLVGGRIELLSDSRKQLEVQLIWMGNNKTNNYIYVLNVHY